MSIIKPHEAETDSSRLAGAAAGGPVVTASADRQPGGAPAVHVRASAGRRVGFLAGRIAVPPDFDRRGSAEIARRFEGEK